MLLLEATKATVLPVLEAIKATAHINIGVGDHEDQKITLGFTKKAVEDKELVREVVVWSRIHFVTDRMKC